MSLILSREFLKILKKNFKFYRLNYQINASRLRILDETGKQIGILDKNEALKLAQSENKDLVEIASQADPPVVKLIDFKKFKYLESKKERENKRSVKNVGIKEIRLTPFMGEHDFRTRIKYGQQFLKDGNQLRISIFFRGRTIVHKEFGYNLINKAIGLFSEYAKVVKPPYMERKVLVTHLSPFKKKKETYEKNENEENRPEEVQNNQNG